MSMTTRAMCGSILVALTLAAASAAAQRAAAPPPATVNQLMRGILFPNSNVVFFAQSEDPDKIVGDQAGSRSTDPLTGVFGKWEAVENSALALAEAADLLTLPGRTCSNGKIAPVQDAEWKTFVRELRASSLAAYKAAKEKNQETILMVAGDLTDACSHCHAVYRESNMGQAISPNRCVKRAGGASTRPRPQ